MRVNSNIKISETELATDRHSVSLKTNSYLETNQMCMLNKTIFKI